MHHLANDVFSVRGRRGGGIKSLGFSCRSDEWYRMP